MLYAEKLKMLEKEFNVYSPEEFEQNSAAKAPQIFRTIYALVEKQNPKTSDNYATRLMETAVQIYNQQYY